MREREGGVVWIAEGWAEQLIINCSLSFVICQYRSVVLQSYSLFSSSLIFLVHPDCEHLVAMEAKGESPTIKHIWRLSIEAALKCVKSRL